ncbi:hypothetical protein DFH06DRAFT_1325909 [Mycena polygramma]|nr:hypothetical protein DFH06DRAFT_1325909 [Mycena polygramma]
MSSRYPPNRHFTPVFGHARLSCLAGYYDVPNISTAMTFDLTYLERVNTRIVRVDGRVFEVWSPNSSQLPFLAGERRGDFLPSIPSIPAERRYDGHAGRHDCLYVPQYFRADVPHWPYVRRVSEVPGDDVARPAFTPFPEVWITETPDRRKGYLNVDFVSRLTALTRRLESKMALWRTSSQWATRPQYANEGRVHRLAVCRSWDEVVDLGVALQRGLREQEAWLVYMQTRQDQHRLDLPCLRETPVPPARERFIGLWVNGLPEMAVLRFLVRGVPCFIVHEYLSTEVPRAVPEADVYSDFVSGTGLVLVLGDDNPYQSLARDQGCLDSLNTGDDGRGPHVLELALHERRSSSVYLQNEARRRALAPPPAIATTTSSSAPASAAPETLTAAESQGRERITPLIPHASRDRFAASEIELRVLEADRSPWIVPPPLQANWNGKWTKWELDEVNNEAAWISRKSTARLSASSEWFDREKGRRLFFGKFRPAAGLLDWERFGAPVPRHPFFTMDGDRAIPQSPSHWMYPKEKVPLHQVGKRAPPPRGEGLALLGEGRQEGKGKGKARMEVDDDDEEDEDEYGMEVDGEAPANAPSNVVVVGCLDEATSAVMFQGLSAQALWRSSARPLTIMRAQGRMWLRFANITEGRRAFGALGSIAYGLTVEYRSDAEFREAARYTRDLWNRELEDEEMVSAETPAAPHAPSTPSQVVRAPEAAVTRVEVGVPQTAVTEVLRRLSLSPRVDRQSTVAEEVPLAPEILESGAAMEIVEEVVTSSEEQVIALPSRPPQAELQSASPTAIRLPPSEPRAMRAQRSSWQASVPPSIPRPRDLAGRLTSPPREVPPQPRAPVRPSPHWLPPPPPSSFPPLGPTIPLLHRMKDHAIPLASPLRDPPPPLLSRVDRAPPLMERLNLFPPSIFDRVEAAEDLERPPKRSRDEGEEEEEEEPPVKFQTRKKKRGSRAGRLAQVQKREKEDRRAAAILRELAEANEEREASERSAGTQPVAGPSRLPNQQVAGPSTVVGSAPPSDEEEGEIEPYTDVEEGEIGVGGWGDDDDNDDERPYATPFYG